MKKRLSVLAVAALLLAALAIPLVVNSPLFGALCPHTQAVSINCDLAQTVCSDCTNTCLTTCQETQPQMGNFTFQPTNNNTQAVQDTQIVCNKVFGCRIFPLTGGCILDPNDPLPPQYKQPWKTVNCPG